MGSFIAFLFGCLFAFLSAAYRGLMLTKFWAWFVVSQFPGVPHISISAAVGLSLFVFSLTWHGGKTGTEDKSWGETFATSFVYTSVVFFMGWVVTWFM